MQGHRDPVGRRVGVRLDVAEPERTGGRAYFPRVDRADTDPEILAAFLGIDLAAGLAAAAWFFF